MWETEKFYKKEIDNFNFKIKQLKEETITGRHILASLGSVGLTFVSNRFKDYLKSKGELTLFKIIEDCRNLEEKELKKVRLKWG